MPIFLRQNSLLLIVFAGGGGTFSSEVLAYYMLTLWHFFKPLLDHKDIETSVCVRLALTGPCASYEAFGCVFGQVEPGVQVHGIKALTWQQNICDPAVSQDNVQEVNLACNLPHACERAVRQT